MEQFIAESGPWKITDENRHLHLSCRKSHGYCMGWHCSQCGKATSDQGHWIKDNTGRDFSCLPKHDGE